MSCVQNSTNKNTGFDVLNTNFELLSKSWKWMVAKIIQTSCLHAITRNNDTNIISKQDNYLWSANYLMK